MATGQQVSFCFVMTNVPGARFEEHCFNISRYILYSVFYYFGCKPYHIANLHNTNTLISLKWKKDIPKRKMPSSCILKAI